MKTLATMSGQSAAVCPDSKLLWTSGQLALQAMVMNTSGLPKDATLAMATSCLCSGFE